MRLIAINFCTALIIINHPFKIFKFTTYLVHFDFVIEKKLH